MIERDMRGKLVALLRPLGAFAVENGGCHPGTPDVACTAGWIECKATNHWPVRPDTPVRLDHPVTPQQKIFAKKWARVNGLSWFMLNISAEWLLFEGLVGVDCLGTATRAELYDRSLRHWRREPTTEELLQVLAP